MNHWAEDAIFYHVYPLGLCGAPEHNNLTSTPQPLLQKLIPWIEHAHALGATALYLGPLFESSKHGYDTIDYFHVDRRLGDEALLTHVVDTAHQLGLRVIFDAVLGHVGREFWAFRDVQSLGSASPYAAWFRDIDFSRRSFFNDAFAYAHWQDAPELPQLQLACEEVRKHLFMAIEHWVTRFHIDGLRLDAADSLDDAFLAALRTHCTQLDADFWLTGEVVHGDYRRWANKHTLHSVSNYEAYKGLWSSHVDKNMFEIAYALERQFGEDGLYLSLPLYNFADNHDVNRVASQVSAREQLFSLYCLLFTIPGVPSLYAGSEWGIEGTRSQADDRALRPELEIDVVQRTYPSDLHDAIQHLCALRHDLPALRHGDYRQLLVTSEQLVFQRRTTPQQLLVAINISSSPAHLDLTLPELGQAHLSDRLNPGVNFVMHNGHVSVDVPCHWARVLLIDKVEAANRQ